jgi:hypothetical protein
MVARTRPPEQRLAASPGQRSGLRSPMAGTIMGAAMPLPGPSLAARSAP